MGQWVAVLKVDGSVDYLELTELNSYHALGEALGGKLIDAFRPYHLIYQEQQVFIGVDSDACLKKLSKNNNISSLYHSTIFGDVVLLLENPQNYKLSGFSSKEEAQQFIQFVLSACVN